MDGKQIKEVLSFGGVDAREGHLEDDMKYQQEREFGVCRENHDGDPTKTERGKGNFLYSTVSNPAMLQLMHIDYLYKNIHHGL